MPTISFHNGGGLARRNHNIRRPDTVEKQKHIDKNGIHEIWTDEKPVDAYNRIFGDALKDYNAKQTREERKIRSYYNHIQKDSKKHTVYECIVSVGSIRDPVEKSTARQILWEFYNGWKSRNPHLELIGCYLHMDEATPHLHMDYIPVADGCYKKGLSRQNSMTKALELQGIKKEGKETAQIIWERRERAELENICNRYSIHVEHPLEEGRKHIRTEDYKMRMELESVKQQKAQAEQATAVAKSEATRMKMETINARYQASKARKKSEEAEQKLFATQKRLANVTHQIEKIKADYTRVSTAFNALVQKYNLLLGTVTRLGIKVEEHLRQSMQELTR